MTYNRPLRLVDQREADAETIRVAACWRACRSFWWSDLESPRAIFGGRGATVIEQLRTLRTEHRP